MKWRVPRALVATVFVWVAPMAWSGAAWAEPCGSVTYDGLCVDSKTVVWCDEGSLAEMICPPGEVCAAHENFDGGVGCISTRLTACGEIPQEGVCARSDEVVVWCDADEVRTRVCDAGTRCAWVEDEAWYDCVPTHLANATPSAGPDQRDGVDGDDSAGTAQPPAAESRDAAINHAQQLGPIPGVEPGVGPEAEGPTIVGGGGACAGGPANGPPWSALLVLAAGAWWFALRRPAHRTGQRTEHVRKARCVW